MEDQRRPLSKENTIGRKHKSARFSPSLKHIENKNLSKRSNFATLKKCIILNVSLTKTEQNT